MATTLRTRRLVLATVVAASALLLTGCAPIGNTPTGNFPGFPEGTEPSGDVTGEPQAAWVSEGDKIAITLFGSSTCPYIASTINVVKKADEGNAVSIEVPALPDQPCTMDLVPHTTEFWTPQDVTTTKPLQITVLDQTIELPIKSYNPGQDTSH
ncbi:hypothetical protein [Microterricola pindariensis]|uniref:hypothetical protein n=1 Tax=Microterricola pindariensis TaxID=478010 RepID=UPI00105757ED|nr:hypothetical protein [Microterricola pindariensis]